jgi:hypothetical protein
MMVSGTALLVAFIVGVAAGIYAGLRFYSADQRSRRSDGASHLHAYPGRSVANQRIQR